MKRPIGEMGHPLTIGQKFRIALARAILRDPALLIIEEPHAPLDEDSKSLLDDTFARILPGRTVIFLPHRLSTIRNCDRVYSDLRGPHRGVRRTPRSPGFQRSVPPHLQYLEFNEFAGTDEPSTGDRPPRRCTERDNFVLKDSHVL